MPRKTTEREHKLSAIEGVLKLARQLINGHADVGNDEIDGNIIRALDAVQWLRDYPDSLLEELAKLERDQFNGWSFIHPEHRREITTNDRAWAKAVIEVFKTGSVDLRRKG